MSRHGVTQLLKSWIFTQALLLPGATLAAGAAEVPSSGSKAQPTVKQEKDEELGEVLVNGMRMKATRNPQEVIDWLARLVGKFTYDGSVDLHGKGIAADEREVSGVEDCLGFGPAPAVQCTINVRWPETHGPNGEEMPGGVSTLDPATMLFGFEPDRIGVRYMLVDSKGIAEDALGLVSEDTLVSRAPCVNIPGNCQRIVHITAAPDLKVVVTRIDLEIDSDKAVSFELVAHRVPGSSALTEKAQRGN